jgi:hypothetical protein
VAAPAAVHPHLPRFADAITGMLGLEGALVQTWPAVAVALGLVLLGLAGPRWSPVDRLFALLARPPREFRPAAPVRFAQAVAATALALALLLMALGLDAAGWAMVAAVALVALLSAVTGTCPACAVYRRAAR